MLNISHCRFLDDYRIEGRSDLILQPCAAPPQLQAIMMRRDSFDHLSWVCPKVDMNQQQRIGRQEEG